MKNELHFLQDILDDMLIKSVKSPCYFSAIETLKLKIAEKNLKQNTLLEINLKNIKNKRHELFS